MDKVRLFGKATITANSFHFSPRALVRDFESQPKVYHGQAVLTSDGTFEFQHRPRKRYGGTLIKKLAHGRLSATKDGGYLLTLKFLPNEQLDIARELSYEAFLASKAI